MIRMCLRRPVCLAVFSAICLGFAPCAVGQDVESSAPAALDPQAAIAVDGAEPDSGFEETEAPRVDLYEQDIAMPEEAGNPDVTPDANGEGSAGQLPAWWPAYQEVLTEPAGAESGAEAQANEGGDESVGSVGRDISYVKVVSTLCIVLACIILGLYGVRRIGKRSHLFAGSELATVLGRVYLDPRSSLHFVRAGRKILVVGVTRNGISPVAELDDDVLQPGAPVDAPVDAGKRRGGRFAALLRERTSGMLTPQPAREEEFDDREIVSLRDDIQRLQRTLREPSGEADND